MMWMAIHIIMTMSMMMIMVMILMLIMISILLKNYLKKKPTHILTASSRV